MGIQNRAKERLAEGDLVICMGLRAARTSDAALLAHACGFDAFYVDLEHGSATIDAAGQICSAALALGITPLARVPEGGHADAARLLDAGAQGIVFPHIETADEAAEIVAACALPPLGRRGVGGASPRTLFAKLSAAEINASTLTVAMLETREGIDNADAIAAVPGIDVLHIGTNDLCASLGIPGQFDHPDLAACYERVHEAAKRHGKTLGVGAVQGRPERTASLIALGARFIVAGNDVSYLMAAAANDVSRIRAFQHEKAA
jgi:2-keto-3-deoxy-L-rhamnonate aldolase RhmA